MQALSELYNDYVATFTASPRDGTFVTYDWGNLPSTLDVPWMAYSQMFDEFSREIANSINQLVNYTHRLKAWSVVMRPLNTEETLAVLSEFVEPLATVALNLPYVIKSRFVFASAHLGHQANRLLDGPDWKDDLPLDGEINFNIASARARRWRRFKRLKLRVEALAAQNYRDASSDFRNKYNHRISPRIVIGLTGMVTRATHPTTGATYYGFGETPPMAIDTIVSILNEQCSLCGAAFEAFKAFVAEHATGIRAEVTASFETSDGA